MAAVAVERILARVRLRCLPFERKHGSHGSHPRRAPALPRSRVGFHRLDLDDHPRMSWVASAQRARRSHASAPVRKRGRGLTGWAKRVDRTVTPGTIRWITVACSVAIADW